MIWAHPFPEQGLFGPYIDAEGTLDARFIILTSADPKLEVTFDLHEGHDQFEPPCTPPAIHTQETY